MIPMGEIGMSLIVAFFACFAFSLFLMIVVQVSYPKHIRADVFTSKYFNEFELGFMRGIPYGLLFTATLVGATLFPRFGAGKRFYDYNVREKMPRFVVVLCYLQAVVVCVAGLIGAVFLLVFLFPDSGLFKWDK